MQRALRRRSGDGMTGEAPALQIDETRDVERILVVMAHPDDVDFGAAGSVAVWTKMGIHVTYCIVTDGDAGGSDRSMLRADMAKLRREEQRAAAAVVGVTDLTFLGYPDGKLVPSIELRRDISREIRRVQPQRVVCQSPERRWDLLNASHPDHLAAGEATVCAVYPDARNPFAHPELLEESLEPHTALDLWLAADPNPNRAVEVTDTFQRKVAAVRCHVSQIADEAGMASMEGRLREFLGHTARLAGLEEGRLAEAFRVATIF